MSDDLIDWFKEADGFHQGTKAPHKWVLQAHSEIIRLRARIAEVEKERDNWKLNCQSNAAAMNNVEEVFGQIFPVGVRAGAERGPDPVEWAADVIVAMHIVRERAEAALATARRDVKISDINAEAMAEIKAVLDGKSSQTIEQIVFGALEEIRALVAQEEPKT